MYVSFTDNKYAINYFIEERVSIQNYVSELWAIIRAVKRIDFPRITRSGSSLAPQRCHISNWELKTRIIKAELLLFTKRKQSQRFRFELHCIFTHMLVILFNEGGNWYTHFPLQFLPNIGSQPSSFLRESINLCNLNYLIKYIKL